MFTLTLCLSIDMYGLLTVVWVSALIYSHNPKSRPNWTKPFALTRFVFSGIGAHNTPAQNIRRIYLGKCIHCGAPIYQGQNYCEYCDSYIAYKQN